MIQKKSRTIQIFLDFPHYARLNKNFAKSRTMQIRTKQGPTVLQELQYILLLFNDTLCIFLQIPWYIYFHSS